MNRRTAEKEVFCLSWKESTVVEQRKEFIQEYLEGKSDSFKALCQKYGISEKTAINGKIVFSNMDMQGFVIAVERRRTARLSWMKIQ